MDRVACVDLPELPLQVLLRRHPDWDGFPVAVVDRDKPQGVILWVNESARVFRILPGMRYATGLSLSRELRAGVVSDLEIAQEVNLLTQELSHFSPRIEPSPTEPGVFWLDASGLVPLYPSLHLWASAIQHGLRLREFESVVAAGFTRFGTYAAAKSRTENIVFDDPKIEQAHVRAVSVDRLGFSPKLRDALTKLGILTLGGFIDLPPSGVRRRFGAEGGQLHELARGGGWKQLTPRPVLPPAGKTKLFDSPETDLDRLVAEITLLLRAVLEELAARHEALAKLEISLLLDNGRAAHESLAPAEPTLDANQLVLLIRLRLEALTLPAGVMDMTLQGEGVAASLRQLELFHKAQDRDLSAVHRAFAKIRAELGNDAVVRARLHEGHFPEARFGWEPVGVLPRPKPQVVAVQPLVRRIYSPPVPLPQRARREPDGWIIGRLADGPVDEIVGPHIVSGEWWSGEEESREYHYVRTRNGRWLWIYKDRHRRRWFLHGEVE